MLTGSIVAVVTPMHEDGSLDLEGFGRLIDWHVAEGTRGIVAVGTTSVRTLETAAQDAVHKNAMGAYWHEWLFLLGSICLVLGLLQIAFQGKGVEGWICLGMVAMILFSLYVGGVGWVGEVFKAQP